MTKEEFLKNINNPLDNDKLLYTILEAMYDGTSIYTALTKVNAKKEDKISGKYTIRDRDNYELYLFNYWKNIILNLDLRTVNDKYQDKVIKLKKLLAKYNPNNTQEIYDFLYNKDNMYDKELEDFLEEHSYKSQGQYSSWNHVSKKYLEFFNTSIPDIKHRFYLNINSTYMDRFAHLFTIKCLEKNLPFYYKFSDSAARADSFVIYSNTANLFKYLEVLEEIKKEHKKEIEENIKKPPILTAKVNEWIGYGSEPQFKSKKKYSYSSIREEIISNVINKFNKHWTKTHKNGTVHINDRDVTYKEFFSKLLYKTMIDNYEKECSYTKDLDKVDFRGFSLNDTKTDRFRNKLMGMINQNIDYILENIDNLDNYDIKKTTPMATRKPEKHLYISSNNIRKALDRQPLILTRLSKNFYDQFRKAVKKEALKCNIPEENFCFDKVSLEEIKNINEEKTRVAEKTKVVEKEEVKEHKDTSKEIKLLEDKKSKLIKKSKDNKQKPKDKDDKPAKVVNPTKVNVPKDILELGRIIINGNVHIKGNLNITVNPYAGKESKDKVLVLNRGRK